MISLYLSIGFAVLMAELLVEALIFRAIHSAPPSMYRLYAVHDRLMRVVIEGKIERDEPHFEAIYKNVNTLIEGYRSSSEPAGRRLDPIDGKHLAHHPHDPAELSELPREALPASLEPVMLQLRDALENIAHHHFGLNDLIRQSWRESTRIQKARAKALLQMMPGPQTHQV